MSFFLFKDRIAGKIIFCSFLVLCLPVLFFSIMNLYFVNKKEIKRNLIESEHKVNKIELFFEGKKESIFFASNNILQSIDFNKFSTAIQDRKVSDYFKTLKKAESISNIYLLNRNGFIFDSLFPADTDLLSLLPKNTDYTNVVFLDDKIIFTYASALKINNSFYYLIFVNVSDKKYLKDFLLDNFEFSVVDNNTEKRVFSTFDISNNDAYYKNDFSNEYTQVSLDRKKYYYKVYPFQANKELLSYSIELLVCSKLFRYNFIRSRNLIFKMITIWILGVIIFFVLFRLDFVISKTNYVQQVGFILNDNVDKNKLKLKQENILSISEELGKISDLVAKSEQKIKSDPKKMTCKELEKRAKELEKEIEKIKSYSGRITDVFLSLTHDIKNPLNVIKGYASTILQFRNKFSEEKREEFLRRIVVESDRLTRMIKNFLATLREERDLNRMTFEVLNIESILKYFYRMYEVKAKEKHVDFILDINEPVPPILGNYDKLEFVVSNLLANAFKFVEPNGFVKVKVKVEKKYLKVEFSNSGIDVIKGKEKEIFDRYKRLSNAEVNDDGVGLGLYIAKEIITKHNGEIGIESSKSKGKTTLYFRVPLMKAKT